MKLEENIIIPLNLEINPYTYLDIILKYKNYLKLINCFGGYMFLTHIYKFSSKSELQTFNDIHAMQDSRLLKIISINRNSYVLLSTTSIKYLKNKPHVAQLQPPTSTQLKTSCYLADYISVPKDFFDSAKPYTWFLEKVKNELKKLEAKSAAVDINFLHNNRKMVKTIKNEEVKSEKYNDLFSKLKTSRIYFDTYENGIVTLLILDFDRSKSWIYNSLVEKIEPIFRKLSIYNSYNIKILTINKNREERLIKDKSTLSCKGLLFLKDVNIINLNIDRFFQSTIQKESFLKDVDRTEISTFQEKLRNNVKENNHE